MNRHRFLEAIPRRPTQLATAPATAFMACPAALQQWMGGAGPWQARIYALALAEARAVVKPSILDRLAAHLEN